MMAVLFNLLFVVACDEPAHDETILDTTIEHAIPLLSYAVGPGKPHDTIFMKWHGTATPLLSVTVDSGASAPQISKAVKHLAEEVLYHSITSQRGHFSLKHLTARITYHSKTNDHCKLSNTSQKRFFIN
jgi:hypothetical protein